ncbi:MAG: DUF1846 domain-containing protein [Eubacteriales bacterium]|nr:DUF1846 domain-containing protein [Eubacteriales bacterium]
MKLGFDNEKYIQMQSERIRERIDNAGNKLYLEFGGKLFDDYHASRVLPGFAPDVKIRMLSALADKAEIIIVISATDIENNKIREDLGITYEADILRLIDAFRSFGLAVTGIVLTRYNEMKSSDQFIERMESLDMKVYKHYSIEGYPGDIPHIVSESGYGKNEYIETTRPLVVVTAPGPGSGKMATCLSQLYHENKRGIKAGYAKFETFPVWNLPLTHPVNLAYEAATADLNDINMIDPFHLEANGETAVNYNRDVEIYPVLAAMMRKIMGECPYKSPTEMGVNMAGKCIFDDDIVREAAKAEIIRRYFSALCDKASGHGSNDAITKLKIVMQRAGVTENDRRVVGEARVKETECGKPAVAIELEDGRIITGKASELMSAETAALINALKALGDIQDRIHIIPPLIFEPIQKLKQLETSSQARRLTAGEALIAISISATTNPLAQIVVDQIPKLKGLEAHSSVISLREDREMLKKLGIRLSMEPKYETKRLFHR